MHQRGFTLLELMIVISIIAVLIAIVMVALDDSRRKARNEAVITQVYEYQKSLELYYSSAGRYPATNVARTARYCIGDGLVAGAQCMGNMTSVYSPANSAPIENAIRMYMPNLARLAQPIGAYDYSSPAYSGCAGTGVGMTDRTPCSSKEYSLWFLLEGTNESCGGRAYAANTSLHGEYTVCRLSSH